MRTRLGAVVIGDGRNQGRKSTGSPGRIVVVGPIVAAGVESQRWQVRTVRYAARLQVDRCQRADNRLRGCE